MRAAGLSWQCASCRRQVSLTSGTVLHNTKTPLTLWFRAAYLMTSDKRGVSALLLRRQFGLRRSETAGMMLHKLRRAMVNFAREPAASARHLREARRSLEPGRLAGGHSPRRAGRATTTAGLVYSQPADAVAARPRSSVASLLQQRKSWVGPAPARHATCVTKGLLAATLAATWAPSEWPTTIVWFRSIPGSVRAARSAAEMASTPET